MKKKIINGILLAAMLFAGTTSFVSCKDNVDDELVPVYTDLSGLKTRVGNLETTVLGHTTDIQNLRTDLGKLENQVKANTESIDSLNARYNRLLSKVEEIEKYVSQLTVGVIVQGTNDPVFGTINSILTGGQQNTLCGFIGENLSKIDQFPVADDDFNAKGMGETLKAAEIDEDQVIELSGAKKQWIMDSNTFGSVFVTLNPLGADATKVDFTLVRTDGMEAPVQLSAATPSDVIITKQLGKDVLRQGEYLPSDDAPFMWELEAFVDSADFKGYKFDWQNFSSDYLPSWSYNQLKAEINYIWNNLKDHSKSKTERAAETIQSAQALLKQIKDAIDNKRKELPQYAIVATVQETGRAIASQANITSVAIEPIGYNLAANFDAATIQWDLSRLTTISKAILKKIQPHLPEISKVNLTQGAGNTINVYNGGGGLLGTVAVDDIITTLNLDQLESEVNDAITFYTRVKTGTGENLINRAQNYINRVTGQILDYFEDQVAMKSVEPILLFETTKGMVKMNNTLNNIVAEDGIVDVAFTSLTGEYIIPVFKKYIAVLDADGKLTDSAFVADGDQQAFELELPEGKSTIVIQTVDYTGYVITKRFPVNRTTK